MLNILIVGMMDVKGGIEQLVIQLFRRLDKSRIHCDFLCYCRECAYEEELLAAGSSVYHVTRRGENPLRCRRELKKVDKRIAELFKILNKLYEDAALEKISEERYQSMAPGYEREQAVLKEKREALTAEIAHSEEIYENIEAFLPVIWKYTNITELTPHILNELIEKIVVHEKVVAEDGSKSQQVDIHYKFIGCVNWKREPASYGTIEAAVLQEHQTLSEQTA